MRIVCKDAIDVRLLEYDRVWCKGDKCMAPWFEDGKYYNASIQKVTRKDDRLMFALVRFESYSSEDDVEVELTKLKRPERPKTWNRSVHPCSASITTVSEADLDRSIFSPLTGNEEQERIREKFSRLEKEESDVGISSISQSLTSPTSVRQRKGRPVLVPDSEQPGKSAGKARKRVIVAIGGNAVVQSKRTDKSKMAEQSKIANTGDSNKMTKTIQARSQNMDIRGRTPTTGTTDSGFDEADMEKPKFGFSPNSAKVPFHLSTEDPIYQVPATINQYLRDYQRDGIQFLYQHYMQNQGAILGDDMGLGKTVQVIGFLSAMMRKQGNREDVMRQKPKFIRELSDIVRLDDDLSVHKPFLVIGPGSVLYNWLDELETWGYFLARKYHGGDKAQALAEVIKGKVEILVTTYETYRDNQDEMNTVEWAGVFVDEVHRIKGFNSQTTVALRKINSLRRFGLTGTVLQNNILELWSIFDWAKPGCLGDRKSFENEYVRKIEKGQKHDATKRELAEARKMKEKFSQLRNRMMIRRTKKLISDQLPRKDDNVVFCKLTDLQLDVYQAILDHPHIRLILSMEDPCDCGSHIPQAKCCHGTTSDGTPVHYLMFTYISLLMKTANHVALLIPDNRTSEGQRKHAREICDVAFQRHPHFVNQTREASFRTLSDPKYCGKMKVLKGLLSVFQKKHSKILLFSYSTKLLDILEQYVISVGYEYRRIDGSVSSKRRMDIVKEFNHDQNIFICLISTRAGGLGLNLTGANVVIVFDPNWNPSHDLQAQDRAYRIGQRRNVQVYRLVSAGTIEENVYLRQVYKQQLDNVTVETGNAKRYFHGIQGDKRHKGELFGIKNMFQLRTGETCLTMDILKRNEKVEAGLSAYDIVEYVPSSHEATQDGGTEVEDLRMDTPEDGNHGDGSEDYDDLIDLFLGKNKYRQTDKLDVTDQQDEESENMVSNQRTSHQLSDQYRKPVPMKGIEGKSDSESGFHPQSRERGSPQNTSRSPVKDKSSNRSAQKFKSTSKSTSFPNKSSKGKSPGKRKCVKFGDEVKEQSDSFSSVSDVFDTCGVVHVHENPKVIGASKAEDHMSRCAIQDVYELHLNSQIPAMQCEPLSESSEDEELDITAKAPSKTSQSKRGKRSGNPDYNQSGVKVFGNTKVLIGQTPKAIKRQQFEKLSSFMKCQSQVEFAEAVLRMSVGERLVLLNTFYGSERPELSTLFVEPSCQDVTPQKHVNQSTPSGKRNKTSQKKKSSAKKKQRPSILSKGLVYESEEESSYDLPANITVHSSQRLSTSGELSEMVIGAKPRPRKSPLTQKPVRTRIRARDRSTGSASASCLEKDGGVNADVRMAEDERADSSLVSWDASASMFDSIPVDQLLDQMADSEYCSKTGSRADRHGDCHKSSDGKNENDDTGWKQSKSGFSLIDDIFLPNVKSSQVKRKPPPSAKKKVKISSNSAVNFTDLQKPDIVQPFLPSVEEYDSTKDLIASMDIQPADTLRSKNSLELLSDPRKWKKRERKHRSETKTNTETDHVEDLISRGQRDYENMFTSGKMRKMSTTSLTSASKQNKINDSSAVDLEKELELSPSNDTNEEIQSPSLFS